MRGMSGLAMSLVPICYASFLRGVYDVAEPCSLDRVPISSPAHPLICLFLLRMATSGEWSTRIPTSGPAWTRKRFSSNTRSPCRPLDCQHGSRRIVRLTVFQLPLASWVYNRRLRASFGFRRLRRPHMFRPDTRWFCFVVIFVCSSVSNVPLLL